MANSRSKCVRTQATAIALAWTAQAHSGRQAPVSALGPVLGVWGNDALTVAQWPVTKLERPAVSSKSLGPVGPDRRTGL